jgi:hypothetical protein
MRALLVVVFFAIAVPAAALSDLQRMELSHNLGMTLASEELCGLHYDQDAIAAFIEKKVPADDMSFAGSLNIMTIGSGVQIKEMSPSSLTAHCAQMKRVAKSYGFIK